jgi:hypothetical protein
MSYFNPVFREIRSIACLQPHKSLSFQMPSFPLFEQISASGRVASFPQAVSSLLTMDSAGQCAALPAQAIPHHQAIQSLQHAQYTREVLALGGLL